MKFVKITGDEAGHGLVLDDREAPVPGTGEVLLDVAGAGVNNADLLQVAGRYPAPPDAPDWPGLEVAGTVAGVGAGVVGVGVGDRVAALLSGGGYAERVAVPAAQLLPVPAGVDLLDAAALPEAACTVWSTLWSTELGAGLRPGEWLLVHGGSGGVGSFAVQAAHALGVHVVTTAGGADRAARCRELGADVVVDHRSEDFVAVVREATGGRGVDVVLDVVGAAYLARNLEALGTGGRLAVIGLQRGRRAELDLGTLLTKRARVLGTTLRSRPAGEKAAVVAGVARDLWPLVAAGAVRPVVAARMPLAEAGRAHDLLRSGQVFGKVVLVP
ncbi:NADPH:quinone oxidoreductase [Actinotalea ferrariae CF5-4]|uniref:NADPH:quinone oxidoreductase n=1 Tax=Actinotalea ferrariae CF5-4 TaxID=948458 RepID=A0A021VSZ0_9CELL|nr:zinc-binding dehydrogenase [Actinotalea ferrariae]EYR63170.1 NADPH:quinone oxidoreductase [Actinotalea ferrariae CF5-4]